MAIITFSQQQRHQLSLYIETEVWGHPGTLDEIRTKVVNPMRLKVRDEVKRHYEGMLEAVTELLNNPPFPNILSAAERQPQSVNLRTPHVGTVYFETPPWSNEPGGWPNYFRVGLSPAYIEEAPKSSVIWQKTGSLADEFDATVKTSTPKSAYIKEKAKIKPDGKDFDVSFIINLPRLHPAVDLMLRGSFASGNEVDDEALPKATSRFNFERILYPEHQRPLLRAAAAALGQAMVDDLQGVRF